MSTLTISIEPTTEGIGGFRALAKESAGDQVLKTFTDVFSFPIPAEVWLADILVTEFGLMASVAQALTIQLR